MSPEHDSVQPRSGEADETLPHQTGAEGELVANLGAKSIAAVPEERERAITGEVLDAEEPKTPEEAIVNAQFERIKSIMGSSLLSKEEKETRVKAVLRRGFRAEVASNRNAEAANRDDLTGALRPDAFRNEVDAYLATGGRFAYALIDLNLFKRINDTHGHPVGDEVLKIAPKAIRLNTRENDPVGRLGGDEFAVIIPIPSDISIEDANAYMADRSEEWNIAFSAEVRAHVPQITHEATMSIGWALSDEALSSDRLYDLADRRMYMRKQQDRDNSAGSSAA